MLAKRTGNKATPTNKNLLQIMGQKIECCDVLDIKFRRPRPHGRPSCWWPGLARVTDFRLFQVNSHRLCPTGTPSIDAAKKLAKLLDTSIGYLLGENDEANLFKDPKMLQRFQDISVLPEKEKECLLTTVDHFIKSAKISATCLNFTPMLFLNQISANPF